ncbi:MAG: NAD kinase [Sphingobacteriales bacterium]|jgi:NAD+ kinase|nr:MAG: NAD kinase [Sphingobacteriales bacterium]
MNIGIYSRIFKPEHLGYLKYLVNKLEKNKFNILIHKDYKDQITSSKTIQALQTFQQQTEIKKLDLIIAIGGDGTILDTLHFVRDTNIPVAGINMGRLGFLADIHKEEIDALVQAIVQNNYTIEKRNLIFVDSNKATFGEINFGLNEFTIHKKDSASMIVIHVYLNGEFLNSFWADGLIIATPTGSTAYSLSCGGPIIFPTTSSFVITPVAPHNLNARPLIIPDDTVLSFEVESRSSTFLSSLDSRFITLDNSYQIAVKKAPFTFNLIRLPESSYLKTLRGKLRWGEDSRNS